VLKREVGTLIIVLVTIIGIITCLMLVAFGGGTESVAAIGTIGVIVSAALRFLDRYVGGDVAGRETE
jgi:hypothetical protein